MSELESISLEQESPECQLLDSTEEFSERRELVSDSLEEEKPEDFPENSGETSSPFDLFLKNLFELPDCDAKLQSAIDFMETSLGQEGTPHFRNFWEVRRRCLPLFKENISIALRAGLWDKFRELSKEARRLKEMLDEQSAFAVEQIEMAVQALENDIADSDKQIPESAPLHDFAFPAFIKNQKPFYSGLQNQLNRLNLQASHINALRKELLKTEMRVRQKNKFFQRLSSAGDRVFPKRKELIGQISKQFSEDVDSFISRHFGTAAFSESPFVLREEIKALQGLAKILTLNTQSFTGTRTRLSNCWDKVKEEEKERKKERVMQRVLYKQNSEELLSLLKEVREQTEKEDFSVAAAFEKLEAIALQMRKVELGRDELKILRGESGDLRRIVQEKKKSEEQAHALEEQKKVRLKEEKFLAFKSEAEHLIRKHESLTVEGLIAEKDDLILRLQESSLNKTEKFEVERSLKPLKDILTEKKEKVLLELSDDDLQTLRQLQTVLKQRKERHVEIKNKVDEFRRLSASSGLDFDRAIELSSQLNEEKERAEKSLRGIKEIECKISELQSKLKTSL